MDDNSGYVNWSDYFGANQEAAEKSAQGLVDGLHDGGAADPATIASMSDKNYGAARSLGEGGSADEFKRTGEAARQGAMSYGEAARKLQDPGTRAAIMAKQHGPGRRGNDLDSAMAGQAGGSRFADEAANAQKLGVQVESRNMDAVKRKSFYEARVAGNKEADAKYKADNQAEFDRREKIALGEKYALQEFDGNPNPQAGQQITQFTPQQRQDQIRMRIKYMQQNGMSAKNTDGTTNWDNYRRHTATMNRQMDADEAGNVENWGIVKGAGNFFNGLGGGNLDTLKPYKPQSWDEYYAKNKSNTGGA